MAPWITQGATDMLRGDVMVTGGTLRLTAIALGGWALAVANAPSWTIFALVALGMADYGVASVIAVRYAHWGIDR